MKQNQRPISEIAREIKGDWKNIPASASAYLNPMMTLTSVDERYFQDSAPSVIRYFLSNATTWRGEVARRVKKELNDMVKNKY
jgi:hypothetical protein